MHHDLSFAQGRAAERRRVAAILLAPEAAGRERLAIEIALNSTLDVAGALKTLDALSSAAQQARANQGENDGR